MKNASIYRKFMILTAALAVLFAAGSCAGLKGCNRAEEPGTLPESREDTLPETTRQTETPADVTESTEPLPPSTVPHEVDGDVIAYRSFFGKKMMIRIADLNFRTLENEGSGLFDLLSDKRFTASEVLQMIETYSCDSFTTADGRPFTEERKAALKDYRNLDELR